MRRIATLALVAAAVCLAAPPADAQGRGNAQGDTVLKFDQRTFQVREDVGEAVISVERFKGSKGAVSVDFRTVAGSATPGEDYVETAGVLTWADGDTSRKTFTVPVLQDELFEVRETVGLVLENLSEGASLHPGQGQAVLMILDVPEDNPGHRGRGSDDEPGTLRFLRDRFQGIEGEEARVVVERVGGRGGEVSALVTTADGSATAGDDYEATSEVVTFGDGEAGARAVTVLLLDDELEEGNETVELTLSEPTGGAALAEERATAELVILDADGDTSACVPDAETLCLAGRRFRVTVDWRTPDGASGSGKVDRISDNTGLVWFFAESNKEILVKVLDACRVFDRFWVFFAATTNVDFTLTVTDTRTGLTKEYTNVAGEAAEPVQDTLTFATCGG